jgi:hypothetical protein
MAGGTTGGDEKPTRISALQAWRSALRMHKKGAPFLPVAGKERMRFSLEIRVKRRKAVQRRDQAVDRVSNQPAWGPAC